MKKLIVGGLAAAAIGLAVAPVAGADDYTTKDLKFVSNVTSLGYHWVDPDTLITAGHQVCTDQEAGIGTGRTKSYITRVTGDTRGDQTEYYATLFMHYAAMSYCPWQPAAKWNI